MAISKITLNGVTQMDVTQDTVDANNLFYGETATKSNGVRTTGTVVVADVDDTLSIAGDAADAKATGDAIAAITEETGYNTTSDVFASLSNSITTVYKCHLTKKNKVCCFAMSATLSDLSSGSLVGTLKTDFYPKIPYYVIVPVFDTVNPYAPVGTIWIQDNGKVYVYYTTGTAPKYFYASYVCA